MLRFSTSTLILDADDSDEIREKLSLLQQTKADLAKFLQDNIAHAGEPLFRRKLLEYECVQQKCSLYSILLTPGEVIFDDDSKVIMAAYEEMLDKIYNNSESASYYVIELLKIDQANTDDTKLRSRIGIAIQICQKKVQLMQLAADLMLEKLLQQVNIKPKDPALIQRIKDKFTALSDYDWVTLTYTANNFTLDFKIQSNPSMLTTNRELLPSAKLLEQLLLLHTEHMPTVSLDMLTDMYACAASKSDLTTRPQPSV